MGFPRPWGERLHVQGSKCMQRHDTRPAGLHSRHSWERRAAAGEGRALACLSLRSAEQSFPGISLVFRTYLSVGNEGKDYVVVHLHRLTEVLGPQGASRGMSRWNIP